MEALGRVPESPTPLEVLSPPLGTPAEMNQVLEIATEKVEAPEPWRLAALGKYLLSLHRTKHQDK
ncbi:MAG: hypothetical protein H0W47_18180 [Polaromonas sp.]|uniref:hypothetical protein n=1 Tax=Polaromonas sp. TaxID=1869339 RepID=UPI0017DC5B41|nr:hypothetical protein [Polaromonas sp.]MBA3595690.1 hypothetical protein [Polaromonas sp.]